MIQQEKYDLIKFIDGNFSLDVNVSPNEDTVWLTQSDIALLFVKDRKTINRHIQNILKELELDEKSVCSKKEHTAKDGKVYTVRIYNLDMIIAIGYRVKSYRAISFRRWATSILKQYLLKGHVINEERCLSCTSNIIDLQTKYNDINNKIKEIEESLFETNDKIIYEGELLEPITFLRKLFFLAKDNITITDFYADSFLLTLLKDIKVPITIITSSESYLNNMNIPNNISIVHNDNIHGRYIFIDQYSYVMDNSFNSIGKKRFVIVKLENINKEMILKSII